MPQVRTFLLILFSILLLEQGASSLSVSGAVYVKFDSYRQQNPDNCDPNWFGSDHCDPYFIISVATQENVLGTLSSTEYDNAPRIIHFGNRIGQLPNPLIFSFTSSDMKPNDKIQVSVTVKDKNPSGAHDFMSNFDRSFNTTGITHFANGTVNSSWSAQPTQISSSSPGHTLNMAVWITCRPNYYQAGCSVHCDPSRFDCSSNGSLICPAGHVARNSSCAPLDKCQQQGASFCLNGGECAADLQGQPVCQCPINFTGLHCQLETHPCHRNATWCSKGTCQTFNSNGTSVCVCDKGFTGYHCDQDVDECRLVAGLCGSNGDCVNSVGSFRCICRDGFSGTLCQSQPVTPPSMRASVAAVTPSYEASPLMAEGLALPILLLAALMIIVCALTGLVAGIMIYHRKHSSRVELRFDRVAYQPNSSQAVTILQPHNEPVESTYYEEVEDEPGVKTGSTSLPNSPATGDFANSAYGPGQTDQSLQLTLNSRSYSRKNSTAGSQQQQGPPEPPPRSPSTRISKFGLDTYLVSK